MEAKNKRSGDINYNENGPLNTDSKPWSLLRANVTQALINKKYNNLNQTPIVEHKYAEMWMDMHELWIYSEI